MITAAEVCVEDEDVLGRTLQEYIRPGSVVTDEIERAHQAKEGYTHQRVSEARTYDWLRDLHSPPQNDPSTLVGSPIMVDIFEEGKPMVFCIWNAIKH